MERGKCPVWTQVFEFYVENLKDEIVFKIWDKDLFFHDPIGIVCAKISSLAINGGTESVFDIMYGAEKRGQLHLLTMYTPSQMQQSTFDSEHIEDQVREQLMTNNYTKNEIKALENKIKDINQQIINLDKDNKQNLDFNDKTEKKIKQYDAVSDAFDGN